MIPFCARCWVIRGATPCFFIIKGQPIGVKLECHVMFASPIGIDCDISNIRIP